MAIVASVAIGGRAVAQAAAARHPDMPPRIRSPSAFLLYLLGVTATEEQHVDDRRVDPTHSAAGNGAAPIATWPRAQWGLPGFVESGD